MECSKHEKDILEQPFGPCFLKKLLEKHSEAKKYFNYQLIENKIKEIHKQKTPISAISVNMNDNIENLSPEEIKKLRILKIKKKRKKYMQK